MRNMKYRIILLFVLALAFAVACTDKHEKLDNSVDPDDIGKVGDTVYIQQTVVWKGFNKPQDMIIGKETFLYVADTENDRIVLMDVAGHFLGEKSIKHPIAIAQDFRLNLLVCGQFDTTINGKTITAGALYKIDVYGAKHDLNSAKVTRLLPRSDFDLLRPDREYSGVCVFADNSFLVARRGPANSDLIDPDNTILIYKNLKRTDGTRYDTLTGKVPLLQPEGTGIPSANRISSLTSFRNSKRDIIITLAGENSFKAQWLRYVISDDFTGYRNNLDPSSNDMMQIGKFEQPEDVCLDRSNNIFVVDAAKDSVFKFNSFGDEMESFGGSEMFDSPHAVAYFDRTLYVLDTNNDRIVRFILSTEID